MKKLVTLLFVLILQITNANSQHNLSGEDKIWKQIHHSLSDFKTPKDSLIIYSLNFTIKVEKREGKLLASKVIANDSLAYELFPNYKKLLAIDFSPILGSYTKSDVMIPILIYGSSPEKVKYKDEHGQPLINFNAAVNSALALVSNKKYDNSNSAYESPGSHRIDKRSTLFRNVLVMEPYIIYIANIK